MYEMFVCKLWTIETLSVAVLAIHKVGPRRYHFHLGRTSGPTTWPQKAKTRISTEMKECVLIA